MTELNDRAVVACAAMPPMPVFPPLVVPRDFIPMHRFDSTGIDVTSEVGRLVKKSQGYTAVVGELPFTCFPHSQTCCSRLARLDSCF